MHIVVYRLHLELEEFIGYINSLVENSNVKVILITNENKIEKKNYHVLKEKIVGNTIEFIPKINETFDKILETRFIGSPSYKDFLSKHKQSIIEQFEPNCSNLRTLIFILTYYQIIFSEVENNLDNEKALKEFKDEIHLNTILFSISTAIEYKAGKISFKKREDIDHTVMKLDQIDFNKVTFSNEPIENENAPNYRELFLSKYYSKESYYYYESIFDYITGGSGFVFSNLIKDLKEKYHIKDNIISPGYQVIEILRYQNCFNLNNNTYIAATREMLKYCDKGLYELQYYVTVFHFALRFNNPLKLNEKRLRERLIKGMIKAKKMLNYTEDLDFYISNPGPNSEAVLIRKMALEINEEIKTAKENSNLLELEILCYKNFFSFSETLQGLNNQYSFNPVFSAFNPNKFYTFYNRLDISTRWDVIKLFKYRYNDHAPHYLKQEMPFILSLKSKLDKKVKYENRNLTGFTYIEFQKQLTLALNRLEKIGE